MAEEGCWAIIADDGGPYWNRVRYEAKYVERVTAKMAYAQRRQWRLEQVTFMPSEEVARRGVAKLVSARAEAERREKEAWAAYKRNCERILHQVVNQ